ncbi:glycosyltransferase family A protein [Lentisphaerota bacterium ZTH]|nr:glycosyltransferase family 2 protein [Lentisphaerota bacterium]WET05187.1 glycosyltransferase family A protein [Lentisphaerota bacterium ZTH]
MDKRLLKKYLSKTAPAEIEPALPDFPVNMAVVIPVLAELEYLPETLQSLAGNPVQAWDAAIVLLVINSSDSTEESKVKENDILLSKLRGNEPEICGGLEVGRQLFWIDANSAGRQLSEKGGVGEARKLGMDNVLALFEWNAVYSPLFCCLDADTVVSSNYLSAGRSYFSKNPDCAAATFEFMHREGHNTCLHRAIVIYELFMRYYLLGLEFAGSPYNFNALGSAIATPAESYIRCGGMRPRNGGEDFYFLQAACKYGQVGVIKTATVMPSARSSDRVPFGTGPKVSEIAAGNGLLFYCPAVFVMLKKIYLVIDGLESPGDYSALPEHFSAADPVIGTFMRKFNFESAWKKIYRNTRQENSCLKRAFNTWFDAFKTLKFVHMCENEYAEFARVEPLSAFKGLLEMGAEIPVEALKDEERLLIRLREN